MVDLSGPWRGVFVIVTTPFQADNSLDADSLRRTVRFCLECGVDGVVATANASEVAYLTEPERRSVAEIVVEEAKGKIFTVVGVSSACASVSAEFARHAQAIGADGLMAMPPTFQRASEREIIAFYEALASASSLPVMLQNFGGPGGTTMSPALMAGMLRSIPAVQYVKEETEFSSVLMTEVQALGGDALKGVMGGRAGLKLLDEFRRGACGTMPACEVADVHVALWRALEAGEEAEAKRIYRLLLPLLVFEMGYGPAIYKEVLHRREVIASPAFRQTGGRVLDHFSHVELSQIMTDLEPLMRSPS